MIKKIKFSQKILNKKLLTILIGLSSYSVYGECVDLASAANNAVRANDGSTCTATKEDYQGNNTVTSKESSTLEFTASSVSISNLHANAITVLAENDGSIIFDNDVNIYVHKAGNSRGVQVGYYLQSGALPSNITVKGDATVNFLGDTSDAKYWNYGIFVNAAKSLFDVKGNLTINKFLNGINVENGGYVNVDGKTTVNGSGSGIVLNVGENKATFNELEINTINTGITIRDQSTISSTGSTIISTSGYASSAISTGSLFTGSISLGDTNINSESSTIYIGENAQLTSSGDESVTINNSLNLQNTTVNIKGSVSNTSGGKSIVMGYGDDTLIQSAGSIIGDIYMGNGNNRYQFSGGTMNGNVYMGYGDDVAIISQDADVSNLSLIDGGAGTNTLTLNNQNISIYTSDSADKTLGLDVLNWNVINLENSQITLSDNLFEVPTTADNNVLNIDQTTVLNTALAQTTIYANVDNQGTINLQNGDVPTILTIEGNYVSNGGSLKLDSILGNDTSVTDKLVITGDVSTGASGATAVYINNIGGLGDKTIEGIKIVEVNGTSSDDAFVQGARIVAGAYDYKLKQGSSSDTNSWYLTSERGEIPTKELRPEAASYIGNLMAANSLFNLRLHDRLGETQYTDLLTGEQKVTSMWMRYKYGYTKYEVGSQLNGKNNWNITQLGGDIAQWGNEGKSRLHLGLMAGYGRSTNDANSKLTVYKSSGKVDGYSFGVYGTWYSNEDSHNGFYLDSWASWNRYHGSVHGQDQASEKYDLKGLTASIESGYTLLAAQSANYNLQLQPKGQLTWMGVKMDDHIENEGTKVSANANNLQLRLGLKTIIGYRSTANSVNQQAGQLFLEANWLHNTKAYSVQMDDVRVSQDGGRNIAEIKAGLEGRITPHTDIWFNLAHQVSNHGYSDTGLMLGLKYLF